jgi:hypothetical protein
MGALIFAIALVLLWRFRARRRREAMTNKFVHSKSGGFVNADMGSDYHPHEDMYEMRESSLRKMKMKEKWRDMKRREMDNRRLERRIDDREAALRRLEWRQRLRRRLFDRFQDSLDKRKRRRRMSEVYLRDSRPDIEDFPANARDSLASLVSYYL